ncbi:pyridoxal phosphate-dependent aminotransferase [Desulfurella sp.]|uniref:pyridoxal phosphate-dependent aminotransferase n=1 Tax=Desulfurella sp. TaxID=1962857 RepID=UPI0025BDBBE5|nr:pyridoxal phosphate-dependent aminotransferase [Desulfurella sp.]
MDPKISEFFDCIEPSCIRKAGIMFSQRQSKNANEQVKAINVAIGNVSLPTHPAMLKRFLNPKDDQLTKGIWRYTQTEGIDEVNDAFKNIIRSFLKPECKPNLYSLVDTGGSHIMRLVMLGVCGKPLSGEKPLLVVDPVYTNYVSIGEEIGRSVISIARDLTPDGVFSEIDLDYLENLIKTYKPGGLLIIPYDNPSGILTTQKQINEYAKICMKHNMFLISDEAYRGLYYIDDIDYAPSIWNISEHDVKGIESAGIRISIETLSKVFNACGLRMGALVTDNKLFFEQARAANTTYLCPSAIDQYIAGALAHESLNDLQNWVKNLREYYKKILKNLYNNFKKLDPNIVVTQPQASIYSIVDVRNIVKPGFDMDDFVMYCANEGFVDVLGQKMTLLVAPIRGFYKNQNVFANTQARIACVVSEEEMEYVPYLFVELVKQYEQKRSIGSKVSNM